MAPADRPKSDWDAPAQTLGATEISRTEDDDGGFGGAHCLGVADAERLVEGLTEFSLDDVGSAKWFKQHADLEKLNQQAHASARDKHDEFILEAFLTFDKLGTLVYDLILVETWRERVYPLLEDLIVGGEESESTRSRSMRCYFVLYHEATVVNLLECLCYHAHAVGAIKDASLDLTDYCARRLAALHSRCTRFREATPARDPTETPVQFMDKLKKRTAREELAEQALQVEFTVSVSCVALVRMVVEHVGELTVSAVSRIVDKHDFLLSVVPLIEHPPWTRARYGAPKEDGSKGKRIWQKLQNGEWKDVPHDRLLDVTKLEAQAWFALYWLSMHPEVRKRYGFDAYRKQTLLRARRYVNDSLLDQIPVLSELQRFMDELQIVNAPEPTALADRQCLMQQVAAYQECITRGADYAAIAKRQVEAIWNEASMRDDDMKALVDIYAGDDVLGDLTGEEGQPLDLDKLQAELNIPPAPPPREEKDLSWMREVANVTVEDIRGASPAKPTSTGRKSNAKAKIVDSEDGNKFKREKWVFDKPYLCGPDDSLAATIEFGDVTSQRLVGKVSLPKTRHGAAKQWRQLGVVADGLAAQLLCVRVDGAESDPVKYRVEAAFVSTPASVAGGFTAPPVAPEIVGI